MASTASKLVPHEFEIGCCGNLCPSKFEMPSKAKKLWLAVAPRPFEARGGAGLSGRTGLGLRVDVGVRRAGR